VASAVALTNLGYTVRPYLKEQIQTRDGQPAFYYQGKNCFNAVGSQSMLCNKYNLKHDLVKKCILSPLADPNQLNQKIQMKPTCVDFNTLSMSFQYRLMCKNRLWEIRESILILESESKIYLEH
jgi:hypothetical protein